MIVVETQGFVDYPPRIFVLLYFFLLAIVLSVLLRYTDSDYPFGIFKLFLLIIYPWTVNMIIMTRTILKAINSVGKNV